MGWENTGSEAMINLSFLPQELEAQTLGTRDTTENFSCWNQG